MATIADIYKGIQDRGIAIDVEYDTVDTVQDGDKAYVMFVYGGHTMIVDDGMDIAIADEYECIEQYRIDMGI